MSKTCILNINKINEANIKLATKNKREKTGFLAIITIKALITKTQK